MWSHAGNKQLTISANIGKCGYKQKEQLFNKVSMGMMCVQSL